MATWTAASGLAFRRRSPATPRRAVSRSRWSLAGTLEVLLEPALSPGPRLSFWPRIPYATRLAVAEPMHEIVSLLRDPAIAIADEALERILAFATHPTSPAFGRYPVQARFAAYSLADGLRPAADCLPS